MTVGTLVLWTVWIDVLRGLALTTSKDKGICYSNGDGNGDPYIFFTNYCITFKEYLSYVFPDTPADQDSLH